MSTTDERVDRLERLVWQMVRDGSVRGVMWSEEAERLLMDMQRERLLHTSSEIGHG